MSIFINFIVNGNLIALLLPLSAFLYALLDRPFPNVKYWKFLMLYMLIVIVFKFIYQFPIFCGSPAYTLYIVDGCSAPPMMTETLLNRIDYIIGIHKFAGASSFPKDQGILEGIAPDLLVLLALLLHKDFLINVG